MARGRNDRGYAYLVLVPVHSGQGTDMSEDVLNGISELESIDVSKTVLNMSVDDELG